MSHPPDELESLSHELRSTDPAVRATALARLEAVVREQARAVVSEALRSDNPEVRANAEALLTRLDSSR